MQAACDILIVGGGIAGASLAHHLARRRVGNVLLLERAHLGAGITGKCHAIWRHPAEFGLAAPLARLSRSFFEEFHERVGGPAVVQRCGLVVLAREEETPADRGPLPHPAGPSAPFLTPIGGMELLELDPNARLGEGEVAYHDADAGTIDPVAALAGFADAARQHGADLRQGVEVQSLLIEKGKIVGVETNEGRYLCGTLILTAGPWSAGLTRGLKPVLPILPCRTQVALFRRPTNMGRRGIIYIDRAQGFYFMPAAGELIQAGDLAGAGCEQPTDPEQYDEAADADWLPGVRQRLNRRYPVMHQGFGRGGYGALTAVTPDRLPILDRFPGVEGVWCAAGFNGDDVVLAAPASELLAGWIVGEPQRPPELEPFAFSRFEKAEKGKDAAEPPERAKAKRSKKNATDSLPS